MKKKTFNLTIFILVISITFLVISTSIVSYYPSKYNTNETSKVKKSPISAQNLAWTVNGNPVCTSNKSLEYFRMCSDADGGAIFTWHERVSIDNYDIYAQHIDSNGQIQWGVNGTVICDNVNRQYQPEICSDGDGGAIIAWEDYRNEVYYKIFAQHIYSNGSFEWIDNGVPISNLNRHQNDPKMVSDGDGGAIITWEQFIELSDQEIYAQRIDSNGLLHWGPNGTAICDASGTQKDQDMCSDGAGGAFITFTSQYSVYYGIFAQHIDLNGQPQWWVYDSGFNFSGIRISDIDEFHETPKICSDGTGGAIITWHVQSSIEHCILAQRVNSSGQLPWGSTGMSLSYDDKVKTHPEICSDDTGGAIITWTEIISGNNLDIYAQHIDSSGQSQWGDNGTIICDMVNRQWYPKICSDGARGAIITWEDYRNGDNDNVYAQRIDSNGNTQWKANGTSICNEIGNQNTIQIGSDGAGTIIIAWRDRRNQADYDIYAQQIYNPAPTSNHPSDIITTMDDTETINWTLLDDAGGGIFRVYANNTVGNYYWVTTTTTWTNNTINYIQINRTSVGYFAYTIVYYDNQQRQGVLDTVLVQITGSESSINGYSIFILSVSICMIGLIFAIRLKKKKHLNY